MTAAVRIAVLGAGVWLDRLCRALAERVDAPLQLRCHARRPERLAVIVEHARARGRATGSNLDLVACARLEEALDGATAVILLWRVGGLAARAWDERFPTTFGAVGDEGLGPGGAANAWRTLPVLQQLGAAIAQLAPAAWVLNLMAPLGVTTRLLRETGLRAIGLCELPIVTRRRLAGELDPTGLAYAGLNHLGWFWPTGPAGVAHLQRAVTAGLVDAAVLEHYGAAPLPYYYEVVEPLAGARLGRIRRPGRADELQQLSDLAVDRFGVRPGEPVPALAARPTPWFDDAVAPALAALLGGPLWPGAVNVPVPDWLDGAPPPVVVEAFGTLTATGVGALATPRPPAAVAGFLAQAALGEDLLYRACCLRDRRLLAEALAIWPFARTAAPEAMLPAILEGEKFAVA